ncbi:MAG: ABC transporter permease subunit [Alphaproteobacteria bacterium]|nr:ABC transporter permease subunit [Alphaproteobacteria bacterium]MBV9375177.1 ABC transporter permease subunit [Alphaproteobacteria bacterium]
MARFSAAIAGRAISLLLFLAVWEAAARLIQNRLFPGAGAVLDTLFYEIVEGKLLHDLAATLLRVAIAFAAAMLAGTVIGIAMGLVRSVDVLFDSWIVLFLNLPALVIAVLLYVWLGLTEAAAITAVALSKLPAVVVTLREGTRALDRDLAGMARSFRLDAWRTLRHVILPQLLPYLLVAARSGLALIWKIVLVVELLGRPDGIGYEIQVFFQLFDIKRLIAYSLAFVAVVLTIEWCILLPLERGLLRWRQ